MAAMRAVPRRRGREIARMQRRRACAVCAPRGETAANPAAGGDPRPRPHARWRASTLVAPSASSTSSAAIAEQFV
nr:nuclear localized factor 2 [Burkholderia pseudomallei]